MKIFVSWHFRDIIWEDSVGIILLIAISKNILGWPRAHIHEGFGVIHLICGLRLEFFTILVEPSMCLLPWDHYTHKNGVLLGYRSTDRTIKKMWPDIRQEPIFFFILLGSGKGDLSSDSILFFAAGHILWEFYDMCV